jgi:hypothetical protein
VNWQGSLKKEAKKIDGRKQGLGVHGFPVSPGDDYSILEVKSASQCLINKALQSIQHIYQEIS